MICTKTLQGNRQIIHGPSVVCLQPCLSPVIHSL